MDTIIIIVIMKKRMPKIYISIYSTSCYKTLEATTISNNKNIWVCVWVVFWNVISIQITYKFVYNLMNLVENESRRTQIIILIIIKWIFIFLLSGGDWIILFPKVKTSKFIICETTTLFETQEIVLKHLCANVQNILHLSSPNVNS